MYPLPTVGRIVQYRSDQTGAELAAIVSEVHSDGTLRLHVMMPVDPGMPWPVQVVDHVKEGLPNDRGSWHWPERIA